MTENQEEQNNIIDNNKSFSGSNQTSKMEILLFKNEVLSDIKKSQKLSEDKLDKFISLIESKFSQYDEKIKSLNNKLEEITQEKPKNNINQEHIKNLLEFQTSTNEDLITINIKLENLEKDIYNNVYRIDKILTESVIYPGIVGNMCKFKTFHDFMDYLLAQTSQNITFRDKFQKDLKLYKIKTDKYLKGFSNHIDSVLNEANIFTKKCIEEAEIRTKYLFDEIEEKIKSVRVDNENYMEQFDKNAEAIKNEIIYINEMKEEIDKILEEKLILIQEDNNKIKEVYEEQKNELNLIKDKLSSMSSFLKDIGKLEKKSEYINFSNKLDSIKNQNTNKEIKPVKKVNNYESKIKKYIQGEINAEDLGSLNANNMNNNTKERRFSKMNLLNKHNFNDEKRNSELNNYSFNNKNNIHNFKSTNFNNSQKYSDNSISNYYMEYNTNKNVYMNKSNNLEKRNSQSLFNNSENISIPKDNNKNQINNKRKNEIVKINSKSNPKEKEKESSNPKQKTSNFNALSKSKETKTENDIKNINNMKNKEIIKNKNNPKNRNPKEINKNLRKIEKIKKKKIKKKVTKKNKEKE